MTAIYVNIDQVQFFFDHSLNTHISFYKFLIPKADDTVLSEL